MKSIGSKYDDFYLNIEIIKKSEYSKYIYVYMDYVIYDMTEYDLVFKDKKREREYK